MPKPLTVIDIAYESANGVRMSLCNKPYIYRDTDLTNHVWTYSISPQQSRRVGGRVRDFRVSAQEFIIVVQVEGRTFAQWMANQNALFELYERDVANETPGRIWINGQYAPGYIFASQRSEWDHWMPYSVVELRAVLEVPMWHTEASHDYPPGSAISKTGKKYPFQYPYSYGTGFSNASIINNHYAASPMRIVIFGPIVNPQLFIAENLYGVTTELLADEYLVIDQLNRQVYRVTSTGERINEFNNRSKVDDPFAPLPSGVSRIQYNGSFGFEITVIEQRSEPRWIAT